MNYDFRIHRIDGLYYPQWRRTFLGFRIGPWRSFFAGRVPVTFYSRDAAEVWVLGLSDRDLKAFDFLGKILKRGLT